MSECSLLQPRPSPRGRELHSLHQEQHQLSTLQGHQVRGKSRQRHRRPLEATTCPLCHPALALTSFWGRSSAGPPQVGRLPSAPRAVGGASLGPGREGLPSSPARVGTLPAGMLLPSCPRRRNLVEEVDARYMKTCLFHKTLHPLCPVFKLGYVVQESGQNFSTLAEKV